MAGYSGTPLAKKLGIRPGQRVALLRDARDVELGDLDESIVVRTDLRGTKPFDLIVFMTTDGAEMEQRADALRKRLTIAGMLWLGWPKKASGVETDLSDARVRAIGLDLGLVDNKTCAIDEVWSGLRFVRRLSDR